MIVRRNFDDSLDHTARRGGEYPVEKTIELWGLKQGVTSSRELADGLTDDGPQREGESSRPVQKGRERGKCSFRELYWVGLESLEFEKSKGRSLAGEEEEESRNKANGRSRG